MTLHGNKPAADLAAEAGRKLLDPSDGAAVLRVPGFLAEARCRHVLEILRRVRRESIASANLDSEVWTLGATQGSHVNRGTEEYFRQRDAWAADPAFSEVTGKDSDVTQELHAFFAAAFQRPVEMGVQDGRELWPAVVRSIDYVGPHVDDVSQNGSWDIGALREQFAWNIYLSVGEQGGQTVVYGRGLDSKVPLQSAPKLQVEPEVGDLILINSRLVHEVLASRPAKKRITLNGMLSPKPSPKRGIVVWS